MSGLRLGVPAGELPASALYRDFVGRADAPIHARVGGFRSSAASWKSALAAGAALDSRVAERMAEFNAALGASKSLIERLHDARTRVVITGQQPGVMAGPLLSLHKAATAVALANAIEATFKTPCVPVFWLGADDDDFAEIRELALATESLELVSVSLGSDVHAPGRRVGDIPASAVARAWDAVRALAPKSEGSARIDDWIGSGSDLGSIAARTLVELTGGRLLVIDGREPVLRHAARDLLLAFFDREDEVRARVSNGGTALTADGYHAQLEMGADSGLFWTQAGVRRRIPADVRATARAAMAADIGIVSPGVVARNLVQDSVFKPVAVVLGPAEIAYRAQIADVYPLLGVATPVVFPRLTATFVPSAVASASHDSKVDATLLARDAAEWTARVTRALESPRAAEGARVFTAAIRAESERFLKTAGERLDVRAREKLEKRVADLLQRAEAIAVGAIEQDALAGGARWPWLARVADVFARNGDAQERYLSALVPYTFHGADAVTLVSEIAADHVRDALDGRVLHRVYSR